MYKLLAATLLCTVMLSGCNVHKIPASPTTSPTPTPSPTGALKRYDVSGKLITTEYAEGLFVKVEENILTITENGQERQFRLTDRAKSHIPALSIVEGTRIIVNFNLTDDGLGEAVSIEKIVSR